MDADAARDEAEVERQRQHALQVKIAELRQTRDDLEYRIQDLERDRSTLEREMARVDEACSITERKWATALDEAAQISASNEAQRDILADRLANLEDTNDAFHSIATHQGYILKAIERSPQLAEADAATVAMIKLQVKNTFKLTEQFTTAVKDGKTALDEVPEAIDHPRPPTLDDPPDNEAPDV